MLVRSILTLGLGRWPLWKISRNVFHCALIAGSYCTKCSRWRRVRVPGSGAPHVEPEVGSAGSLPRLKAKLLPSHVRNGLEPSREFRSRGGAMPTGGCV